jgi:hypothetical protein
VAEPQRSARAGPADLSADPAVRRTLRVFGSVVAPATLLTSLLYYFGWTVTHASSAYLGIDESVLGFSTQDYLLRSVNAVYWPLSVGLIASALALRGHITVMRAITKPHHRQRVAVLTVALAVAGIGSVTYGALALHYGWVSAGDFSIAPLCLTVGVALFAYTMFIHERAGTGRAQPVSSATGSGSLAAVAVALLIAVGLFWQVADWATAVGVGRTRDLVARLDAQPRVTVYSAKQLDLAGVGGVTETTLSGADNAYHYQYDGLRLLFRSGGRYLLLSDQWNRADGRTILIADAPDLRFEFAPGG